MLRPGPCFGPVHPWLSWPAGRQVAVGVWFGLHPVRRSPVWWGPGRGVPEWPGPVEPRQALRWLATHYLPRTTRSQPLGPIFGSGIGLPGMPIGTDGIETDLEEGQ